LGEALAFIAKYRDGLGRFLTDGRVEIDNNATERCMRAIAKRGSLCGPSSSVCKHRKCVRIDDATRATFSGYGSLNHLRGEIFGTDLIRRTAYNLHRRQFM
jgi:transposase